VWYLSCGQAFSICAAAGAGVTQADNALGWKTTIFDTKANPSLLVSGIRQAIAARADAIVIYGAACSEAKQPLADARNAGIKIVGVEAYDCNQTIQGPVGTIPGQPQEFSSQVRYVQGDFAHYFYDVGVINAEWLIAKEAGKANVIAFVEDDEPSLDQYQEAVVGELRKCPGCTVHQVPFGFADLGPGLTEKTQQALLKYPTANGAWAPSDADITSGIGPAIASSGRKLAVVGAEGEPANMALVRAGGREQTAGIGLVPAWEAWSAVDNLIRLFDGKPTVSSGIGIQIYEPGHNVPASGGYVAPVNFRAVYRKAWGLG
jgi:ribose transport system substrate-binding protein